MRIGATTTAALLAIALLGACGDDSGTSASDDPATTAATADPAVLGERNEASGEPVRIGYITEGGSDAIGQSALSEQGARIAVDYVNDYLGGIGGRPIELVVCGNQSTPAGAQDCANQLIQDDVAAAVVTFSGQGSAQVPLLVDAGIPYIGYQGAAAEELTSPGAFGMTGGFPVQLGAFAQDAAERDLQKVSFIAIDVPAATQGIEALGGIVFGAAGVELDIRPVPPGTPDMTPQIQAAISDGADAVAVVGDVTFCTSFLQSFQTIGADVLRYVIPVCVDQSVIDAVPGALEGAVVATNLVGGDDAELYAAMVAEYAGDEGIDPDPEISSGVAFGVSTLVTFGRFMGGLQGDPTPETVLAQMQAAHDVPIFLSGGATATCDGTAVPMLPNICAGGVQMGELEAGGSITDARAVDGAALYVG